MNHITMEERPMMETLESRRLLAGNFDFGVGPATNAVICEFETGYRRTGVEEAVDFWIDFYDRLFEAFADDVEDGFFTLGLDPADRADIADSLRDILPDDDFGFEDGLRNVFTNFGGFVLGGGSGFFFGSGSANFGEANRAGDGQAKASRYEGGLFADSAGSSGAVSSDASEALTSSAVGFAPVGDVSFSDVPAGNGGGGAAARAGGVFGGGYA